MTCLNKRYASLMNKVLDGDATVKERNELFAHLATCDSCDRHFKELKRSTEILNHLAHPQLSADFTKNVLEQLPAEKQHVLREWTARHPVIATAAICVVPMSLLFVAAGRQNSMPKRHGEDSYILVNQTGSRN
ncbi:anti-sigma factor family protein [Sporolactobacillus vineae]|uniref:anti-sigma factor family protein n=1 Tax=Sporolactobacillus vineae TaxID=444463 RepID=UPI000289CE8A|nr:zf-HC2 domain-containing protein [Sporolactobacillus vineae]